jgi:hypothetical protein
LSDSLGLNQPDRQGSPLCIAGVEEQDGFRVAFLMQEESGSDGAALP